MSNYNQNGKPNVTVVDLYSPVAICHAGSNPICNTRNLIPIGRIDIDSIARSEIKSYSREETDIAVRKLLEESLDNIELPDGVNKRGYRTEVLAKLGLIKNLFDLYDMER